MCSTISKSILIIVFFLVAITDLVSQPADSLKSNASKDYFVIETRHKLYPSFLQIDTVALNQQFLIGEDEYKAEVITFNPHLGITDSGKILQMSDTLYNPAVRIKVVLDSGKVQKSWAFYYGSAPHFYRDHFLGFKLLDFKVSNKYIKPPKKR